MANGADTQSLLKRALEDCGELGNGRSSYHEYAIEVINEVYLGTLAGSNIFGLEAGDAWSWARNAIPRSFTLQPNYNTGTVSLTNGSTSGTFGTAPSSSMGSFKGRTLVINDRPSAYVITAHVAGATAFTIDQSYVEATGATLSFNCLPLRYNLGSKILRLAEPMRFYGDFSSDSLDEDDRGLIHCIDLNELRRKWPLHRVTQSMPNRFATQRRNDSEWWIEVNGYPDTATKVDFDCVDIPAEGLIDTETSIPLIPREHNPVLHFGTSHFIAIKKKEPEMAKYFYDMAQTAWKAMEKSERRNVNVGGKNKGRMLARQEQLDVRGRIDRRIY